MPRGLILLLVLGVGVSIAVQPAINSQLSRHTGALGAAFVSLGGSALAVALLLVASGNASRLSGIGDVSPVYLTGGLMGAFDVTVSLFAISRIGAGGVVAVSITSQLIVAATLDHFGLLGLKADRADAGDRAGLRAPDRRRRARHGALTPTASPPWRRAASTRERMPSSRKMDRTWNFTVLTLITSSAAICAFE